MLEQPVSLFPMTPGEQRTADIALVRQVLTNERVMRQKVFKDNLKVQLRKTAEIDQALESLARIERGEEESHEQTTGPEG